MFTRPCCAHFSSVIWKCEVCLLKMFATWRFSVTDVCLVSLRFDGMIVRVMPKSEIEHWVLVHGLFNPNTEFCYLEQCCVWQTHVHLLALFFCPSSGPEGATWISTDDVAKWNEEICGEFRQSRCLGSPWLGFIRPLS